MVIVLALLAIAAIFALKFYTDINNPENLFESTLPEGTPAPVELTPAQEDGHVVYRGVFTAPDEIELVWYHFRLSWADGGTSCCGKAGLCAWDAMDVGIAIGSAAAAAADARVDNRVMFSVGRAARSLGLLGASVTLVLGIPLSVSGKSPFFDRKPKK